MIPCRSADRRGFFGNTVRVSTLYLFQLPVQKDQKSSKISEDWPNKRSRPVKRTQEFHNSRRRPHHSSENSPTKAEEGKGPLRIQCIEEQRRRPPSHPLFPLPFNQFEPVSPSSILPSWKGPLGARNREEASSRWNAGKIPPDRRKRERTSALNHLVYASFALIRGLKAEQLSAGPWNKGTVPLLRPTLFPLCPLWDESIHRDK